LPTVAAVVLVLLAGCRADPPRELSQRCGTGLTCASGLRCSAETKRCYRPVDCKALDQKLQACLAEVVAVALPEAAKASATARQKALSGLRERITADVVGFCRRDDPGPAKKGTRRKSLGEDPQADAINKCLKLAECRPFAACLLEVGRLGPSTRPGIPRPVPPEPAPLVKLTLPPPAAAGAAADGGVAPTTDASAPATGDATPADGMAAPPAMAPPPAGARPVDPPRPAPPAMTTP
jgi:hypothetical protein